MYSPWRTAALPHLLDRLGLEGVIVTIDAAGCQTVIMQDLRTARADYVLAVKRSQRTLHMEVRTTLADSEWGAFRLEADDHCETVERNGERSERRMYTVLGGPGLCEWVADLALWLGLRSLIRVHRERIPGRRQYFVCYDIASWPVVAEALLELVCGHWGIENGLHRTLDVPFRKDNCRLRRGHVPAVTGILKQAALNMVHTVQQNFRPDLSIRLLRDKIGRNSALLAPILT